MAGRDVCWVHWANGGCTKVMTSPSYAGVTDSLPEGIESAPYFKTTKVAEGIFGEEVTAIAKNQAQASINRSVFRGKEQLIVQKRYGDDLENDLNRGVDPATRHKRAKPVSVPPDIILDKVGRIVEVKVGTQLARVAFKGNGTAAGAKKELDNILTSDGNVRSPDLFVDTEDAEGDEIGSNTNDDAYSDDTMNPHLCTPTKQVVDLEACEFPEASLVHFKVLNQDTEWVYAGMDMVKIFHEFRLRSCQNFSFARDLIAELTPGSQFEQALPSHIKPVANLVELSAININERWPTLATVFGRVFASNSYDKVLSAINNEDLTDPVVFYLISIVVSYSHYFAFHSELPQNLNEREAFISSAWSFIRGALTLTNIETRSLEVLITGVEERRNQNLDHRLEVKQTGQFADGVGFSGANQVYLAEASTLHQPKAEKLKEDEYKLVRAMRDSWISQLRATCRESIPCRSMAVFGSSSYKDETKLWMLDFKGVFRLFQIDSFLIPLKKQDFGRK
ncbi:hypothetical protein BGX34_012029 [Mortierella sp. NVP85]|nr:hypothetical protein BGX34_012029 [Mortierella sp. NVP85]